MVIFHSYVSLPEGRPPNQMRLNGPASAQGQGQEMGLTSHVQLHISSISGHLCSPIQTQDGPTPIGYHVYKHLIYKPKISNVDKKSKFVLLTSVTESSW